MKTWLNINDNSGFNIHHLPFGIFSNSDGNKKVGIAIGDFIIDLYKAQKLKIIYCPLNVLKTDSLNKFIQLGKSVTSIIRIDIQKQLCDTNSALFKMKKQVLVPLKEAKLHLPIQVGDYTDFYASRGHATNVGEIFRGKENALHPNWNVIPIAYHGRSSSIVKSETEIKRPRGVLNLESDIYTVSKKLDFELEFGFVIGKENILGKPIKIEDSEEYIFGVSLVNDWSARDIQKFEYVPLGPFLGKSFATSISSWITPIEALDDFKINIKEDNKLKIPSLLKSKLLTTWDIKLEAYLNNKKISSVNLNYLSWTIHQMISHHTSNGCNLRVGDLIATGTISGEKNGEKSSLLEITKDGNAGEYLKDGDEVCLKAYLNNGSKKFELGEVKGKIET